MAIQGEKVGLYLAGIPVEIPTCNIAITQPTIKDIVAFGEDEFLIDIGLISHADTLGAKTKQGNSELEIFSDFQLLLVTLEQEKTIKDSFERLFALLFPDYIIDFTDNSINFSIQQDGQIKQIGMIHNFNFDDFKDIIKILFEANVTNENEPEYNPANDAAAAIAEKIKKGRMKKSQMNAEKEGPQSLFGRYTSILAIGMQMDINIFYNYTPFQLYDAFNRFFSKQSSDWYTRVSTIPLMDVSKIEQPPDWVRNLYKW